MNKSLALRNRIYRFCFLLFSFFLFIYLLYFLINGDRGLLQYFKLQNLNQNLQNELSQLEHKNKSYLDKIKRLQPNTIDLDYLDEVYREVTGFSANNEVTIIMK